jgi:gamma-glutamylcyclotransferase (GGCT)/AIG2-like uncharacterized protein YtfP
MKKYFFVVYFFFVFVYLLHGSDNTVIIGYVENSFFYPFLSADGKGNLIKTNLVRQPFNNVYNAFENNDPKILKIKVWKKSVDVYTKESFAYGELKEKIENEKFYCNKKGILVNKRIENNKIIKSFYYYFSKDPWGKNFVSTQLLSETIHKIETKSGIKILYITDVDSDGHYEVWIRYKLKYNQYGRMVYEQINKDDWKLIVNSCINCD